MNKILCLFILLIGGRSWALSHSLVAEDSFFQNVIYIEAESHSKGESVKAYCSAALISNRLAVTAAHCLSYSWLEKVNELHLVVGKYAYVKRRADGKTVRVGYKPILDQQVRAQFLFSSSLQYSLARSSAYHIGPEEDVAVIALETPLDLPADFAFAEIIDKASFEALRTQISPKTLEAATINFAEEIKDATPKKVAALDRVSWYFGGYFLSVSTSRFAPDDSGGAIFFNKGKQKFLVGVVKGRKIFPSMDVITPVRDLTCEIAKKYLSPLEQTLFCR